MLTWISLLYDTTSYTEAQNKSANLEITNENRDKYIENSQKKLFVIKISPDKNNEYTTRFTSIEQLLELCPLRNLKEMIWKQLSQTVQDQPETRTKVKVFRPNPPNQMMDNVVTILE